jgi:hypothetical protein
MSEFLARLPRRNRIVKKQKGQEEKEKEGK